MTRPSDPLWSAICEAVNGCSDVVHHGAEIRAALDAYRAELRAKVEALDSCGWDFHGGVSASTVSRSEVLALLEATPLNNPRLMEVEWDDVAARLAASQDDSLREAAQAIVDAWNDPDQYVNFDAALYDRLRAALAKEPTDE